MHGDGIITSVDGSSYEGQFHDDAKHGHGVMKYPNGECVNISVQV